MLNKTAALHKEIQAGGPLVPACHLAFNARIRGNKYANQFRDQLLETYHSFVPAANEDISEFVNATNLS